MNKWEMLLLLKSRPNCDATLSYLRTKELKKRNSGATQAWLTFQKKKKTNYNFLTFEIAGWSTIETKNVWT